MTVSGLPPRVGGPIAVDTPGAPEADKATPDKPTPVRDGVDRGAPQTRLQPRVAALPVGDFETQSQMETFSALSAQVGEQPDGLRLATAFEATLPMFETRPALASLAFGREALQASCELMQLVREGTVELPPEAEAMVRDRFATLTSAAPPLTTKLDAAQQQALQALVARFGSVFALIGRVQRESKRSQALRKRGRTKLTRLDAIEADELRELLDEAFDDPEEQPPPLDTFELQAHADLLGLILPDAHLVALEQAWAEEWPKLEGLDRDMVVELVMAQCAAGNENALQELLEQLDKIGAAANNACEAERPALLASCDALSAQLTFYLERRAGFASMVRMMLT